MRAQPNPFDISLQTLSGPGTQLCVRLSGEFDANAVNAFDTVTAQIGDLGADLVSVDMENVTLLDSTGIGAVMRLRRRVMDHGVRFEVHAPQEFQRRLFHITGLEFVLAASSND